MFRLIATSSYRVCSGEGGVTVVIYGSVDAGLYMVVSVPGSKSGARAYRRMEWLGEERRMFGYQRDSC